MAKASSIVIAAHARVDRATSMTLPRTLLTSCKFGELHSAKHLDFKDISIFTNPLFLYEYIFSGTSYVDKGEIVLATKPMPGIVLTPLSAGQPSKKFSWQKPCVEEHLRKMCVYELRDVPENPARITHINFDAITLDMLKAHPLVSTASPALWTHIRIAELYSAHTTSISVIVDSAGHRCDMTTTTSGCYIFDYETGPSAMGLGTSDDWNITDAVPAIENYLTTVCGVDLTGVDSIILESCLA